MTGTARRPQARPRRSADTLIDTATVREGHHQVGGAGSIADRPLERRSGRRSLMLCSPATLPPCGRTSARRSGGSAEGEAG